MIKLVVLLGVLLALLGLATLAQPRWIKRLAYWLPEKGRFAAATIIRLVAGAICLLAASQSRFPLALQIIGFVSLGAALALVLMGRQRMDNMVRWGLGQPPSVIRLLSLATLALGSFLIYAGA